MASPAKALKLRVILTCLVVLGACNSGKEDASPQAREKRAIAARTEAITGAERTVRKQGLFHSEETMFRNVKLCPTAVLITGEVNAKNSRGTYVGYRTFYVDSEGGQLKLAIIHDGKDPNTAAYFKRLCYDLTSKEALTQIMGREPPEVEKEEWAHFEPNALFNDS